MRTLPSSYKPLASFSPTCLVVHYGELALKGKNRDRFEVALVRNLRLAVQSDDSPGSGNRVTVRRIFGRIVIELEPGADWQRVARDATRVFGIAYVMPAVLTVPTLEALTSAASTAVAAETESRTFGVLCKRATKDLPFTSMDVQRAVGASIQGTTGWPVDLDAPEMPVQVEVVNRDAYLGFGRLAGPGGLPTGVAGKVVCLLSGGIDSPVASHRILRRGATAAYVHFHSYPHTGLESQEKVRTLAARVQPPGQWSRLYMVPFADLQRRIVTDCPERLRVVLYRRFMVRVAEAVAEREGAIALVTGESLGQVASQTLENLRTIDAAARLPILRPLIGMDKQEIVEEAQRIGSFDTSIEPHGDCCSFLMPQHPATSSTVADLEAAERIYVIADEVTKLMASANVEEVTAAPLRSDSRRHCDG